MQLKVLSLLALVLIFMLLEDVDAHRRRRYYRRKSYGRVSVSVKGIFSLHVAGAGVLSIV